MQYCAIGTYPLSSLMSILAWRKTQGWPGKFSIQSMASYTAGTQTVFEQIESTYPIRMPSLQLPAGIRIGKLLRKYQPFPCLSDSWDNSCLVVTEGGKEAEGKVKMSFWILFYLPCLPLGATDIWINFKGFVVVVVNCSSLWAILFPWPRSHAWARSQHTAVLASVASVYLLVRGEVKQRAWDPLCRRKRPETIFWPRVCSPYPSTNQLVSTVFA